MRLFVNLQPESANTAFRFAKFSETVAKLSVDTIPAICRGINDRIFSSLTIY